MLDEDPTHGEQDGEELLRRALLDESSSVAVSLKISGLPVSEAVTVIFHGRRDLGTLQTYVAYGSMGAGSRVAASELLRVPCDLDLADADDRSEAERLYAEQAQALRDALVGADTVLDVWREPLYELSDGGVAIDHSVVYPLADDPERCVEDFLQLAAQHAKTLSERLAHQEASVERFLEISDSSSG